MKISMTDKAILKEIRRRIRIAEGELADIDKEVYRNYRNCDHPFEVTVLIGGRWVSHQQIVEYTLLPLYRDSNKMLDGAED